jgi:hypothetical protein
MRVEPAVVIAQTPDRYAVDFVLQVREDLEVIAVTMRSTVSPAVRSS